MKLQGKWKLKRKLHQKWEIKTTLKRKREVKGNYKENGNQHHVSCTSQYLMSGIIIIVQYHCVGWKIRPVICVIIF